MRLPVAVVLSLSIAGLVGATKGVAAAAASLPSARAFGSAQTLNSNVLQLALAAAACARRTGAAVNDRLLTVIDYTKASTEPRLWVLDLESERVLFEEVVAHGRGSGENYATQFSNEEGSYQTSLGLFRTADTYVGANGYSLRLDGLESGVNDRARERAIVIHGAPYVNPAATRTLGRLGRSLGCPALRPAVARTLIDTIKEGSLVFSYYPDREWLRDSRFLNGCSS
jgi:L,D-transpeptidase catalytic domain